MWRDGKGEGEGMVGGGRAMREVEWRGGAGLGGAGRAGVVKFSFNFPKKPWRSWLIQASAI